MYVPAMSIQPRRLCLYDHWDGTRSPRRRSPYAPALSGDEAYERIQRLSKKARQRISTYVQLMVDAARPKSVFEKASGKWFRFKVNFITLTLPSKQQHTDGEIHKRCFEPFIKAWRRKEPGLLYIYKAEVQDNGNLHYHLTTNAYIKASRLRDMWNYYVNRLGYVDRSGLDSPNSTDVHAIRNVQNVAAYIGKYITKSDSFTKPLQRYHKRYAKQLKAYKGDSFPLPARYFQHIKRRPTIKLWDCSAALKVGGFSIEMPTEAMYADIDQAVSDGANVFKTDYACIISLPPQKILQMPAIAPLYREHISGVLAANELIADKYTV